MRASTFTTQPQAKVSSQAQPRCSSTGRPCAVLAASLPSTLTGTPLAVSDPEIAKGPCSEEAARVNDTFSSLCSRRLAASV